MPNPNHVIISGKDFISIANKIHNNQFIYDKVEYINKTTKITITCKEHGDFVQLPKKHLLGQKCPRCRGVKKYNNNDFILEASKKHNNKYNYEKVDYINSKTQIIIICPLHGEFRQRAGGHLLGYGCIKCSGKEKLTNEKFIDRANNIHNNKYNYDLIEYNNSDSILSIICDKHGIFNQRASTHLNGCGCPVCNESKGEREISKTLDTLSIEYLREYKFEKCKYINELRFDFYIPSINLCIEFNGRQHYEEVNGFGGKVEFDKIKKRDNIKYNFCKLNNINLLIIKYKDINEVSNIINERIKEIKNPS